MSNVVEKAITRAVFTHKQLAKEVGVSRAALLAWRRDRRRPRPESVDRLADVLIDRGAELRELGADLRIEASRRRKRE